MNASLTRSRWMTINLLLALLLAGIALVAFNLGSESISLHDLFSENATAQAILFTSRLPRILLAALVGMALASAGTAFQALLRNPLADPFIMGISGGAALGAVASVGFHLPFIGQMIFGFLGAILSMSLIFAIARTRGGLNTTSLLLTGVIFNAFCFALILMVNALVTMEEAYQILFLLIGNIEAIGYGLLGWLALFIIPGFVILTLAARRMNLLVLGDDEARALGVDMGKLRAVIFFAASLMVGAAVAASGLIGFVGLFIPHIVRMLFGSDHRLLIPASGIAGALFLIAADAAARTVLMQSNYATELPVGAITALIGAPIFFLLLRRQQGST